jgi:hypothetical protein
LIAWIDGRRVAFTGDLLAAGGKLYLLHAMEYEYGSMQGVMFTLQSIEALARQEVDACLPSHSEPIRDVAGEIETLERRLMDCVNLGLGVKIAGRETVELESQFLPNPKFVKRSDHLLWSGGWAFSNFYCILSDSVKAMFIDYGHAYCPHMHYSLDHDGGQSSMRFVEHHHEELRRDYGIGRIDLMIPTHIHEDHTAGIPYLQRHHSTNCWALDYVAEVLADPAA